MNTTHCLQLFSNTYASGRTSSSLEGMPLHSPDLKLILIFSGIPSELDNIRSMKAGTFRRVFNESVIKISLKIRIYTKLRTGRRSMWSNSILRCKPIMLIRLSMKEFAWSLYHQYVSASCPERALLSIHSSFLVGMLWSKASPWMNFFAAFT
jgi:hypothetical protein